MIEICNRIIHYIQKLLRLCYASLSIWQKILNLCKVPLTAEQKAQKADEAVEKLLLSMAQAGLYDCVNVLVVRHGDALSSKEKSENSGRPVVTGSFGFREKLKDQEFISDIQDYFYDLEPQTVLNQIDSLEISSTKEDPRDCARELLVKLAGN